IVHTSYSIEFNPGAAITFKKNFPSTTVYDQHINFLLNQGINTSDKNGLPSAKDFMGRQLSGMPQPGEAILIYCGPPCQELSDINRFKKANDIKNSVTATAMGYVDFYRPKYSVSENI
ncbi:hypothetical protein K502DRAFT_276528, partial [Neoconidiobolus thromboides FSU 785]